MTHIRFAWSFCLLGCTLLSLDASMLRAEEPAVLEEPMIVDPSFHDPAPVLQPVTEEEATTDSESESASADDAATTETDVDAEMEADSEATAGGEDEVASETDEETVDSGPEPIRELYPNGSPKVDRQVVQDELGNYVNHGPWKSYDQRGNVTCEGTYENGERHGLWTRWYGAGQAELFKQAPYRDFKGPYISQGQFENGKLQGKWTIYDAKQHKISEVDFVSGIRHGKATWWHINGAMAREIDYRDGQIDGHVLEWSTDSKLTTKDTYKMGRKLALKTQYHVKTVKKSEGTYLFAAQVVNEPDDWWEAKLATYKPQGKDERHGIQTTWYASGAMQMQGEYRDDIQVGKFTWWYANGQKAQEGSFENGRQAGNWVWWHENGQKSIQGKYAAGDPAGRWNWWQQDGKLAQSLDMSQGTSVVVKPAVPSKPDAMATKPAAPNARSKGTAPQPNRQMRR